jgi:hypothetical protein
VALVGARHASPDDRAGTGGANPVPTIATTSVWETIAAEAERESDLWSSALLPEPERQLVAVFSLLSDPRFALGLETIYEGYLLHYGRPRLFAPPDRDTTVLLGDYLYAHGLVRIAELGDVAVVSDLAELLSLCAQLRAEAVAGRPVPDGVVWAATVALLGSGDARLAAARERLRDRGDADGLAGLAAEVAGKEAVARALALHGDRAE